MSDNRDKSPEEIEAEIQATRAAMRADVDAIGEQVSPDRLKDQAKDVVGDVKDSVVEAIQGVSSQLGSQAGSWSSRAVDVVKANPLPAALVGVGMAWLLMRSTGDETHTSSSPAARTINVQPLPTPSYGYGSTGTRPLYGSADYVASDAGTDDRGLRERTGELTQQASVKVDEAKEVVAQRAQQAKRGFERVLDENPLVLTSVARVLGASVSLLLPGTRQEDELMGSTRDQLIDNVREKANAAKDVVQETAGEVTQAVKDEAGNQGLTPDTAQSDVKEFVEGAKRVASEAVDTAKETAQQKAREKGLTQSGE